MQTRALAAAVVAALALPAVAAAHASLVSTTPANGSVVLRAPRTVVVRFDDVVTAGSRTAAVANASGASVLGGRPTALGRQLRIPLRPHLRDGDYTVRWSIVSDDGHPEVGVVAFAVGRGQPAPHAVLDASAPLSATTVALRTLWFAGLLTAAGAAALALLTGSLGGARWRRPLAHLLFLGFLLAFVGDSGLLHGAPSGSRFAFALDAGAVVALAGATAAALAPGSAALLPVAEAAALLLLLVPPLAGHAADRGQPAGLAPVVDFLHLAAAALWLGGLAWLAFVVPRAAADANERRWATLRLSGAALAAVVVLGVTGLGRALMELNAPHELWSTSYGRALLVKTAIFLPLIAAGWLNRRLLGRGVERLDTTIRVELIALVGIVVAVAFLTQLRPGRDVPAAAAAVRSGGPPVLPPLNAVVSARELGTDVVAVGRVGSTVTATVVGPEGNGVDGLAVAVDGTTAAGCGSGCYGAAAAPGPQVRVTVGGRRLVFRVPAAAPDATALLARVADTYRSRRTIVYTERLASTPTNAQVTHFVLVAPDRMHYVVVGGPQAIVVGTRRWDRATAGARWRMTQQSQLQVTHPYWYAATNAHLTGPRTLTFLDRALPAWFTLTLDARRPLPRRLTMTAPSHFMVDRYTSFDTSVSVVPPVSSR